MEILNLYLLGLVIVLAGGIYLDQGIRLRELVILLAWPILAPVRLITLLRTGR